MNWTAIIPLLMKHGQVALALLQFLEKEGPALQALIKDMQAQGADTTSAKGM